MVKQNYGQLALVGLVCLTTYLLLAEPLRVIPGPEGRNQFITRIDTNTIIPGTNITETASNGTVTINSTGGGGGSSILAIFNGTSGQPGVAISSPTSGINFNNQYFTTTLQGGSTAYTTLSFLPLFNQNILQSGSTAYPQFLYVGSSGTVSGAFKATTFTDGTATLTGGALSGASGNISQWTNNSGYLTSLTGAILNQNTLQSATTAYPQFLYVGSTMSVSGSGLGVNGVPYAWPSSQASGTKILQNDGSGNLSWAAAGSGTPGTPVWSFQYNSASSFGGSADLVENVGGGGVTAVSSFTATGNSVLNGGVQVSSSTLFPNPTTTNGLTTFAIPSPSSTTVYFASCTVVGTCPTFTLPPALNTNAGKELMFYKVSNDTGTVTINPNGSDLLLGTTYPILLNALSQHANIYSIGFNGWAEGIGGVQTTPEIWTPIGFNEHATAGVGTSTNTIYCPLSPITSPVVVTSVLYDIATSGNGHMAVGIADHNGNPICNFGIIGLPSTGATATSVTPCVVSPGANYYEVMQIDNTTTKLTGTDSANAGILHCSQVTGTVMGIINHALPGSASISSTPFVSFGLAGGRNTYK